MKLHNLPNIITGFRCFLVIPIALAMANDFFVTALILFVIAGITDGVDGFIAKKFGWQSKLGSILDPIADKFLLVTSLVILTIAGILPAWLVWAAVIRDVVIVAGGVIYYFWIANFDASPSYLSKLNTVVQIVLIFWVVLVQTWTTFDHGLSALLIQLTAVTIALSGVQYVVQWGYKAWKCKRAERSN